MQDNKLEILKKGVKMKVNELVEKLQNGNPTTQDYEMVLQWCTENVDTMDYLTKMYRICLI